MRKLRVHGGRESRFRKKAQSQEFKDTDKKKTMRGRKRSERKGQRRGRGQSGRA